MKVIDNVFQQPDVSKVTPLPVHGGRSADCSVVFINEQGRYQRTVGYWDDIEKAFRRSSDGDRINNEIVRTEEL